MTRCNKCGKVFTDEFINNHVCDELGELRFRIIELEKEVETLKWELKLCRQQYGD